MVLVPLCPDIRCARSADPPSNKHASITCSAVITTPLSADSSTPTAMFLLVRAR